MAPCPATHPETKRSGRPGLSNLLCDPKVLSDRNQLSKLNKERSDIEPLVRAFGRYRDVAKKSSGDASAAAKLAAKIKAGSSGTWGSIPMPPNNVPDADLKQLVASILSQG